MFSTVSDGGCIDVSLKARIAALVVNLAANAVALYGAAGFLADGTRLPLMLAGAATTLLSIAVLSQPSR